MPCHHALAEALRAYIDAAGIAEDRKGWLFRTPPPRQGGRDRGGNRLPHVMRERDHRLSRERRRAREA